MSSLLAPNIKSASLVDISGSNPPLRNLLAGSCCFERVLMAALAVRAANVTQVPTTSAVAIFLKKKNGVLQPCRL